METVKIEGIEAAASRIGLGTWAIGGGSWGGTEEDDAIRTLRSALERGINLIDTAPVYGFGRSEALVGKALAQHGRREEVVLATKVGLAWDEAGRIRRDGSPARIRTEVEDSLRRLRTPYIDLYQVHWPDPEVPFEETAAALERLRAEGKIRAIGVSNFSPDQMDAFRRGAALAADQPPYNLFEREIEADVLPYCRRQGVAVLAYGALCRGLLSGKVTRDRAFGGDDLRRDDPKFQPDRLGHYLDAVERLDRLARERHGRRVIHLAVRWLLDREGVTVALWGARRPEQLDPVDRIVGGWRLAPEDHQAIDAILEDTIPEPVGPEFMAPPV